MNQLKNQESKGNLANIMMTIGHKSYYH